MLVSAIISFLPVTGPVFGLVTKTGRVAGSVHLVSIPRFKISFIMQLSIWLPLVNSSVSRIHVCVTILYVFNQRVKRKEIKKKSHDVYCFQSLNRYDETKNISLRSLSITILTAVCLPTCSKALIATFNNK